MDFSGVFPALTTPFAADGSVSLSDLKHNIQLYNRTDLAGYVALGSTGESVLLSDADLRVNAVGYLAQHLIVLLDPADIVVNLHHAYRRPEFRDRHYASFHTGPSATADIEGVLIHGAQGVRSLSVLPIARATGNTTH